MSEPKRGEHNEICMKMRPNCICNSCQNDRYECCNHKKSCGYEACADYIKDEPIKKGAQNV